MIIFKICKSSYFRGFCRKKKNLIKKGPKYKEKIWISYVWLYYHFKLFSTHSFCRIISEIGNEITRLVGLRANRKEFEDLLGTCQSWLKDKSFENVTSKYEPLLSSSAEILLQNLKVFIIFDVIHIQYQAKL